MSLQTHFWFDVDEVFLELVQKVGKTEDETNILDDNI